METALAQQLRSFNIFLAELAEGEVHNDLTEELKKLVIAMRESAMANGGKASGTITLKLGFKIDRGAFVTTPDVSVKLPKRPPYPMSLHWSTPDGTLTRSDPRQQNLAFRDVNVPEARTVVG